MKRFILLFSFILPLFCCDNSQNTFHNVSRENGITLFFNNSSYSVWIHRDDFSGVVIAKLLPGESKEIEVPASNNNGIGSVFAFEYGARIFNDTDFSFNDADSNYFKAVDPNRQVTINIEANKDYYVQIEQPSDSILSKDTDASIKIKIVNASSNYFELMKGSDSQRQANGSFPVERGKIGFYLIDSCKQNKQGYYSINVSKDCERFENYKLRTIFSDTDVEIPAFNAEYNCVYNFEFNGFAVVKTSETKLFIPDI